MAAKMRYTVDINQGYNNTRTELFNSYLYNCSKFVKSQIQENFVNSTKLL